MRAKSGYRKQKHLSNIGRWLKRYFEKRTCRRWGSGGGAVYDTSRVCGGRCRTRYTPTTRTTGVVEGRYTPGEYPPCEECMRTDLGAEIIRRLKKFTETLAGEDG